MNNALHALQRLRASRTAAVAGVLDAPPARDVSASNNAHPPSADKLLVKVGESAPGKRDARLVLMGRAEAEARTGKKYPTEARRILALPRWDFARALADAAPGGPLDLTARFRVPGGTMELRPIQNLALHLAGEMRGLIFPAAVGAGKTIVSLLVAEMLGALRPVLFIPPALQIPLRREMERLAKHWRLPKNLHIVPYSRLSVASSTALLEQLRPDLIIADEAHNLRNPDAARTRRVIRHFRQFPTTRLVAMSGTLTSKSLRDYAHLCELALREGSPLPTEEADLNAWANCIDANGVPQDKDWSLFAAFSDVRGIPDADERRDAAREVFRERFTSTPGVVATREASVQCSLLFHQRRVIVPPIVADALADLHKTWCRPDGEEMDSALALWRLGMQITQGFYLRWKWPGGVVDQEWLDARAQWHREVRYILQRNQTGLDSPFLVKMAVMRGHLDEAPIMRAWRAWDRVRERPAPPTETVWIDDYLVRDALAWREEHPDGLIWHADLAIESALRAAGVPTFGRGTVPPTDGSLRGMAVSVRVHGTGFDHLQDHHAENLILSWPSSGKTCEQLVGRTHRQGQEADEVSVWYYDHTDDAREAIATSREDARYLQETQGSPQKLVYGTWL